MRSLLLNGLTTVTWVVIVSCTSDRGHAPRDPPTTTEHRAPQIPDVSSLDRDGDLIDDELATARATSDAPEVVEAIFKRPIDDSAMNAFVAEGGSVRHVFRHVSYGFTGKIARSALPRVAASLASRGLLLLKGDRRVVMHLSEATRTGRARPVWDPSFGGGYSGASNVNIAILDGGVDVSHPDLAGRMVGWKDYTSEETSAPNDASGHGTHVAGVAVGSGASMGRGSTLRFTDSGSLFGHSPNDWIRNPFHLPPVYSITSTATWKGGGSAVLALRGSTDGSLSVAYGRTVTSIEGTSPLTLTLATTSAPGERFSLALLQNASMSVKDFTITTTASGYAAPNDAFPTLRGVAADSGWYGAKVFASSGAATTADIAEAIDDLAAIRVDKSIKVANMSFGVAGGAEDPTQRAKVNSLVAHGVLVIASAGNNGPNANVGDPGRAAGVLTVGAANAAGALTQYTSGGLAAPSRASDVDMKPDLIAPGGSAYYSKVISADSNTQDADGSLGDAQANDYTEIMGTSMAAPFVAGAAALVIQALERAGTPWSFEGTESPFLVKLLLLASATETNQPRELGGGDPPLGRASAPKDRYEGYGMINPDAAIEAATTLYGFLPWSGASSGEPHDRRAWGRKLVVPAGPVTKLALDVPAEGDFDVYVYASTPDEKGNPRLVAASDKAGLGVKESLTLPPVAEATTLYMFVKRVAGRGAFTLTSYRFTCGDGALEPGEDCDDGNTESGDCCSATCQAEAASAPCDDGDACTLVDQCDGRGACVGVSHVLCRARDACHAAGVCDPATGVCGAPKAADGSPCDDGDACTQVDVCEDGLCVGKSPVVCGDASSCSASAGRCDPRTGACSDSISRPDDTSCDDGNACTKTSSCRRGACVATSAVSCPPPKSECWVVRCAPVDGGCLTTPKDDGAPCAMADSTEGLCVSGGCVPAPPKIEPTDAGTPTADASPPVGGAGATEDRTARARSTPPDGKLTAIDDDDGYTGLRDDHFDVGGGPSCAAAPAGREGTRGDLVALAVLALAWRRRPRFSSRRE